MQVKEYSGTVRVSVGTGRLHALPGFLIVVAEN
jgi:hypothetical protein